MRTGVVLYLGLGVLWAAACNGPPATDQPCEAAGGACVAGTYACAATLEQYACASGICCIPNGATKPPVDSGTPSTGDSAPPPTMDSSAPTPDTGTPMETGSPTDASSPEAGD